MHVALKTGVDISPSNATVIGEIILSKLTTAAPIFIKRGMLMTSLFPYELTFTLCNIFSKCGSAMIKVNVTDASEIPPFVEMIGSTDRVIARASTLILTASAYITQCSSASASSSTANKISAANLAFTWQVWDITEAQSDHTLGILQSQLKSISKDKTKFILPPYSLISNRVYVIKVIVTDPGSRLSTVKETTVSVPASPLVAIISPRRSSVSLRSGGDAVEIDALSSYDPDVSGPPFSATLDYSWQCLGVNPSYLFAKRGEVTNAELFQSWAKQTQGVFVDCFIATTIVSSQKLALSSVNESAVNTASVIILTVSDLVNATSSVSHRRNSSALVQVNVIPGDAPLISISTSPESVAKVNAKNRLYLTGSVYSKTSCKAVWSIADQSIYLDKSAVGSYSKSIPANVQTSMNLVLTSYTLAPLQASYRFSLSCGTSSSSITVMTNGAPSGGKYAIQPSQGEELSTVFSFTASQWVDVDLPLTYQFGYLTSSNTELLVRSRMELSYASSPLPAGRDSTGYMKNTTVTIFDSYDASTVSVRSVQVTQMKMSDLASIITSKIQSALTTSNSGDTSGTNTSSSSALTVEEMKQLLTISSSALNRVNCTKAPNSAILNRHACNAKDHTCGQCISGYIGEQGQSNSACISEAAMIAATTSTDASNDNCVSDVDCASWQYCNLTNATCIDKLKGCPLDCSGHGTCQYFSVSTGMPLSAHTACTLFMTSCEGKCICFDDFAGSDCSISKAELQAKQEMRQALIEGLAQTMSADVVDSQSIVGAASALQSIIAKSDEVSPASAAKASEVAIEIVKQATELGTVSYKEIFSLPLALDVAMTSTLSSSSIKNATLEPIYSGPDINNGSTVSQTSTWRQQSLSLLVTAIDGIGNLVFKEQSLGDEAVSMMYNNYRFISQPALTLELPMTALEEMQHFLNDTRTQLSVYRNKKVARVLTDADITTTVGSNDMTQQLQAIEFASKLWQPKGNSSADTVQSNILLVKTLNINEVYVTINKLPEFTPTSANELAMAPSWNFTTSCDKDEPRNETFTCPDSGIIITNVCNGTAGVHVSYCPVKTVGCNVLSLSDQTIQHSDTFGCTTIETTAKAITCLCTLPQSSASFLFGTTTSTTGSSGSSSTTSSWSTGVDAIDQTGVLTLAVMSYYVANEFKNTFNAAPNALSTTEDTQRVLTVILLFSTVWALGIILILWLMFSRNQKTKPKQLSKIQRRTTILKRTSNHVLHQNHEMKTSEHDNDIMKQRLSEYVMSVIPGVFKTASGLVSMKLELTRHHSYLRLLGHIPNKYERIPILFVAQAVTNLTALIFLLSLLYDLQSPSDDGTCQQYTNRVNCLKETSMFDYDQTLCRWIEDESNINALPSCVFNPININFKVQFYCATIVCICTALLMLPIDYLFSVVASPTTSAPLLTTNTHKISTDTLQKRILPQNKHHGHSRIVLPEETQDAYKNARLATMFLTNVEVLHHHDDPQSVCESLIASSSEFNSRSTMQHLFDDLKFTRTMLQQSADMSPILTAFDDAWGIDPVSGDFVQSNWHHPNHGNNSRVTTLNKASNHCIEECIIHELDEVTDAVTKLMKDVNYDSEAHVGVQLLQLFILDLLGRDTDAAKLFRVKVHEDYVQLPVVSVWFKGCASLGVIAMNFFFLYYSIIRGYQKGSHWQNLFLRACIIQLLIEIGISETIQCLYINYTLPGMISRNSIKKVRQILHDCIDSFCDSKSNHTTDDLVDVPSYLFVSTQIAKAYPTLMESMMVLTYHSIFPGEIGKKWRSQNKFSQESTPRTTTTTTTNPLKTVLTVLNICFVMFTTSAPIPLQKLVIRFLEPIVLGGVALLTHYILRSWIAILMVTLAFASLVVIGYYYYNRALHETDSHSSSVQPVDNEIQYNNAAFEKLFLTLKNSSLEDDLSKSYCDDDDDDDDDGGSDGCEDDVDDEGIVVADDDEYFQTYFHEDLFGSSKSSQSITMWFNLQDEDHEADSEESLHC